MDAHSTAMKGHQYPPASLERSSERSMSSDQSVGNLRATFLQLQALVSVVLSYQLLFASNMVLSPAMKGGEVLGLLSLWGLLFLLPTRIFTATWFPGTLAVVDTLLVSSLIYHSGNAGSDLYLAYFVIVLLVTTSRTAKQMGLFLLLVTAIYGWALYREIAEAGVVLEQHLLRLPLLIIMAIFYWRMAESVQLYQLFDPVTGLPNRRHLLHFLSSSATHDPPRSPKALLYLDIDGFKRINETLGQVNGDQFLKLVAERIQQCLRPNDLVARVGADEYSILLQNVVTPERASLVAQRILKVLQRPLTLADHELFVAANIGIALEGSECGHTESLLVNADAALSRAKGQGKNSYEFYVPDMNARAHERLVLESRLHRASEREEIQVYYQPQFHLASRRIMGLEALARWVDPESGMVSPATFIPLAEETGLIVPIGESVLRQACQQLKRWHEAGHDSLSIAVNLSTVQFRQPNLADMVRSILTDTGLEPKFLELELTESCVMQDAERALRTLSALRAMGIRISVDDFGTGYSSLIYLRRLPLDTLKIDRAFIQDMASSPDAQAIIAAIMAMAKALNLTVIAEGVETQEQIALLLEHQCVYAQGYVFSKPLPVQYLTQFLRCRSDQTQVGRTSQAAA